MIVLDVETSGTDPKKHSILSIGALDFDDPTNQFYDECRAWDGARVEEEALRINGFSRAEALHPERKSETELVASFIAWATDRPKERTFAAQNVSFDSDFVRAACERAGIDFPFAKRTVDIHTLAWSHMISRGAVPPTENHHSALNSTTILAYCGLKEEVKPHNALTGALWHAEVIARMAYTKNIIPEFSSYPIPWQTH
jgi:DNA polymerase III epsilon subunit-like protein